MMTAVLGVGDRHGAIVSGHGAGDNQLISSVAGDFGAGDGVVLAVQNGFNVAFSGLAAIAVNVVDGQSVGVAGVLNLNGSCAVGLNLFLCNRSRSEAGVIFGRGCGKSASRAGQGVDIIRRVVVAAVKILLVVLDLVSNAVGGGNYKLTLVHCDVVVVCLGVSVQLISEFIIRFANFGLRAGHVVGRALAISETVTADGDIFAR